MDIVMNGTQKGTELLTRKEIDNTPFTVVGTENGYFAVMGQYRLTDVFNDEDDCIKEVSKITWNRLVQVIMLINDKFNDKFNLKDLEENED